mmetsp:Transcript_19746/g.50157  ORF Transcript_19746/g.50157 Transcript_19746/m.50157 type:complete len:490 (-) Transcript_19746:20-1489(-)
MNTHGTSDRLRALLAVVCLAASTSSSAREGRGGAAGVSKPGVGGRVQNGCGDRNCGGGGSCGHACEGGVAPKFTSSSELAELTGWALPGSPQGRCQAALPRDFAVVERFVADPAMHRFWVSQLTTSDVLVAPPPLDGAEGALVDAGQPSSPAPAAFAPPAALGGAAAVGGVSLLRRFRTDTPRPVATVKAAAPASPQAIAGDVLEAPERAPFAKSADYFVYYHWTDLAVFKDRDVVARVRVTRHSDGSTRADVQSVPSSYRPFATPGDCIRIPYLRIEYRVQRKPDTKGISYPVTAVQCLLAAHFGGQVPGWMSTWAIGRAQKSLVFLDEACAKAALPTLSRAEQLALFFAKFDAFLNKERSLDFGADFSMISKDFQKAAAEMGARAEEMGAAMRADFQKAVEFQKAESERLGALAQEIKSKIDNEAMSAKLVSSRWVFNFQQKFAQLKNSQSAQRKSDPAPRQCLTPLKSLSRRLTPEQLRSRTPPPT